MRVQHWSTGNMPCMHHMIMSGQLYAPLPALHPAPQQVPPLSCVRAREV